MTRHFCLTLNLIDCLKATVWKVLTEWLLPLRKRSVSPTCACVCAGCCCCQDLAQSVRCVPPFPKPLCIIDGTRWHIFLLISLMSSFLCVWTGSAEKKKKKKSSYLFLLFLLFLLFFPSELSWNLLFIFYLCLVCCSSQRETRDRGANKASDDK